MSLKTRGLVFATFFGSCLAVGLLLLSLTTNHWLRSSAKRTNSTESYGDIYYGLFSGTKDLNVGYGVRPHSVNIINFIRTEPNVMSYWLWLLTALGTGFGLFSSAVAAVLSVLKAASAAKKHGTMILLLVTNSSSAIAQILAFICWIIQFYTYLTHNVLAEEDRKIFWYSNGLAYLGYSFWLVVLSSIIVIGNLILLHIARKNEYRHRKGRIEPPCEEKNQIAIMLY